MQALRGKLGGSRVQRPASRSTAVRVQAKVIIKEGEPRIIRGKAFVTKDVSSAPALPRPACAVRQANAPCMPLPRRTLTPTRSSRQSTSLWCHQRCDGCDAPCGLRAAQKLLP